MISQPQSPIPRETGEQPMDDKLKATSDCSTAPLSASFHDSSSSFSSSGSDDLLRFHKESFAPSEKGAKKSIVDPLVDSSDPPLQSPRRSSFHMTSPRKSPRRRVSASCDSVAQSYSSLSTAKTTNMAQRRLASRNANTKNLSSSASSVPPLPLVGDYNDQRDMLRPQSDPRSLRRRHSLESSIQQQRPSDGTGIAPLVSPRKDSHLNTPSVHGKRALNRRKHRHDRHLYQSQRPVYVL